MMRDEMGRSKNGGNKLIVKAKKQQTTDLVRLDRVTWFDLEKGKNVDFWYPHKHSHFLLEKPKLIESSITVHSKTSPTRIWSFVRSVRQPWEFRSFNLLLWPLVLQNHGQRLLLSGLRYSFTGTSSNFPTSYECYQAIRGVRKFKISFMHTPTSHHYALHLEKPKLVTFINHCWSRVDRQTGRFIN